MLSRTKTKLVLIIIMLLLSSFPAWGETVDNPSDWAKAEVEAAIENEIVPVQLMSDFNRPITRGEYTLIALKILEKAGQAIEIVENEPFTDVEGHKFEYQLIKAYNAEIIDGYGNGLFKPNEKISREEIATLVVKLLKQIRQEDSFVANQSYDFKDKENISDWARNYIEYCYENDILRGVSELEINPKGEATVEQSILLIYRLAEKEGLLKEVMEQFLDTFDKDITETIKNLSEEDEINLVDIKQNKAVLTIDDGAVIELIKSKYEISLYTSTIDLDSRLFRLAVRDILEKLDSRNDTQEIFNNSLKALKGNQNFDIVEKIGLKDSFEANSEIAKDEKGNEHIVFNFIFHISIE